MKIKKEFALDLVGKYILPASHEIVGTVQTPFPTGIHDLWSSYHLDKIMTISGRKKTVWRKIKVEDDLALSGLARKYASEMIVLEVEEAIISRSTFEGLCHQDGLKSTTSA